jgi:hypothetical protein
MREQDEITFSQPCLPPLLRRLSTRRAIAWNTVVGISIALETLRWVLSRRPRTPHFITYLLAGLCDDTGRGFPGTPEEARVTNERFFAILYQKVWDLELKTRYTA